MSQVLDFILEYSVWIIGSGILVILAVIGYYADKTNFGQGKNSEIETQKNLDEVRLMDVVQEKTTKNDDKTQKIIEKNNINDILSDKQKLNVSQETIKVEHIDNSLTDKIDLNSSMTDIYKNNAVEALAKDKSLETVEEKMVINKTSKPKLTDEEVAFNKFEKEFETLLPRKEVIKDDLLSDIDELELGKTQKIKLNEVPDLDDIDLPKIKKFASSEQDIWKF